MAKRFAISAEKMRILVPSMGRCFITDRVTVDGQKIGYMYREQSEDSSDSGWSFFSGDETQEYLDDPAHIGIYAVNTAANYDPDIVPYLETPPPCAFEKDGNGYRRIEDPNAG